MIKTAPTQSIVEMNYHKSEITLEVQYRPKSQSSKSAHIYPIDP
jgi:hypothetical protein